MTRINLKKINDVNIKPLVVKGYKKEEDKRPIKGSELFPILYSSGLILAKKNSGKTVTVGNAIKRCASKKNTTVIVFCSTVDKDEGHILIKKLCKSKGIKYVAHKSLLADDGSNILKAYMDELKVHGQDDSDNEENDNTELMKLFNRDGDDIDEKTRKEKYQTPEFIFVFDDLSGELKNPMMSKFMKEHRHYHSKIIISTQYVHDLPPACLKQLDYCLCFKSLSDEKIKKLQGDLDLSVNPDDLLSMYKDATKKQYSFLYICARAGEEYRQNFNKKYDIYEVDQEEE
jgi:hypothetical protein